MTTPAATIAVRLIESWSIAPRQSAQLPSAAATPMLAAAGIVVTETRTPISAPDLVEVSESIPAAPANRATITENSSGLTMNLSKSVFDAVEARVDDPGRDADQCEEERCR